MEYVDEDTWITRDGEEIPVSKLTDAHLLNIRKFLDETELLGHRISCMLQGDVALDEVGAGLNEVEYWQTVIDAEITRRGLN